MNQRQKIILFSLLALFVFLRFWNIGERNIFTWDQLDNAWAAKNIIVEHKFPLNGMVAKANSGFYIGPAYYYLITPFYLIFNLDPIASGVFAGLTGLIFFFALFYILKRLFSTKVAFLALFLHTFSFAAIEADRLQWPVNFIPIVSLIIFYCFYRVINGEEKYLIPLSLTLGFSFHIHFTAIFFPMIILLTIPFLPMTKRLIKYLLVSIPLFFVWFIPLFISLILTSGRQAINLNHYLSVYYHGFHLVRFLQLANDALLEFDKILGLLPFNRSWIRFILLPLFFLVYYLSSKTKKKFILPYLVFLWFLVPWIVFTTYSGEISDYYFTLSYPLALFIISYLIGKVLEQKYLFLKILTAVFLFYFTQLNLYKFFIHKNKGIDFYRKDVLEKISRGEKIGFREGVTESYFYYLYTK